MSDSVTIYSSSYLPSGPLIYKEVIVTELLGDDYGMAIGSE